MPPNLFANPPSAWRSMAKALTYRVVIMCADTTAIYLFTGKWRIALGFMIASNVYTTVLYVVHERVWAHVRWGRGGVVAERGAASAGLERSGHGQRARP